MLFILFVYQNYIKRNSKIKKLFEKILKYLENHDVEEYMYTNNFGTKNEKMIYILVL